MNQQDQTAMDVPFATLCTPYSLQEGDDDASDMELNVAYEAMEKMRKYNLEAKCREQGITCVDFDRCTSCLLQSKTQRSPAWLKNLFQGQVQPCLLCATPCCASHSARNFRRDGTTLCQECEGVFQIGFVADCLTDDESLQQNLNRLLELYDRALLLLKYSAQYVPDVCDQVVVSDAKHNAVTAGSSSVGVVSGLLGVAAAAATVTPAGTPLLIASILCGTSATAVQAGYDHQQYRMDSTQLANRILTLQEMVQALVKIINTLRDAAERTKLQLDVLEGEFSDPTEPLVSNVTTPDIRTKALTAAIAGRLAAEGAGQATSSAFNFFRLARVAGGAVSAAVTVYEAVNLTKAVKAMRSGSISVQAKKLYSVSKFIESCPTTEAVETECAVFHKTRSTQKRALNEQTLIELLVEHTKTLKQSFETDLTDTSTDFEDADYVWGEEIAPLAPADDDASVSSQLSKRASLLRRIQTFKGTTQAQKEREQALVMS